MSELSIEDRIAKAQAEITRTTTKLEGRQGMLSNLLNSIGKLARPAIGLDDTEAEKQLTAAEHQAPAADWRVRSCALALKSAQDELAALLIEQATIKSAELLGVHEDVKHVTIDTASDLDRAIRIDAKKLLGDMRDHPKELLDTARAAGLRDPQFSRLQGLVSDWITAQLFSTVRIAPYLDRPLGDLVTDFLEHRLGEFDYSVKVVE